MSKLFKLLSSNFPSFYPIGQVRSLRYRVEVYWVDLYSWTGCHVEWVTLKQSFSSLQCPFPAASQTSRLERNSFATLSGGLESWQQSVSEGNFTHKIRSTVCRLESPAGSRQGVEWHPTVPFPPRGALFHLPRAIFRGDAKGTLGVYSLWFCTSEWIYRHLIFTFAEHSVKYVSVGGGAPRGRKVFEVGVAGQRPAPVSLEVDNGPKTRRIYSRHFEERNPSFCQLSCVLNHVWAAV